MLVIFDCDGVLVDSELLGAEVFAERLQLENLELSAQQCHSQFKGLTLPNCVAMIERDHGVELPENFIPELKKATQQRFARSLEPVNGVEQVLRWLQQRATQACVASNGGTAKIRHSLEVTGLDRYFEHFFSAEQVKQGKPAPDLFMLAADTLGYDANECVVIEDSAAGVQAALAAGMQVYHYNAEAGDEPLSSEVQCFSNMLQLPQLLGQHIA